MSSAHAAPRAAYIHIPFCYHKCGYCDFASLAGVDHLADRYLEALGAELATLGRPREVETIFIGGGTPTRLTAQQLDRLCGAIRHWLPLHDGGEWTVDLKSEKPGIQKGIQAGANCTIEVEQSDFSDMLSNPAKGMQLFMQGKLRVTGDPMLAMKLQKLFSLS